jgi:hypothetical protein
MRSHVVRVWNSNLDAAKYDESLKEFARENRGGFKGNSARAMDVRDANERG